jgi:hypothetical protein
MRFTALLAAALLAAGAASAATIERTEGARSISGVTNIGGDAKGLRDPFVLNTLLGGDALQLGDRIEIFGRIGNGDDAFRVKSAVGFTVSLFGDGFVDAQGGGDDTSLTVNLFDASDTSTALATSTTLNTDTTTPQLLVSASMAGDFIVELVGQGDAAHYDIAVQAVPLPAALPMLGAALGGLALIRRKRA